MFPFFYLPERQGHRAEGSALRACYVFPCFFYLPERHSDADESMTRNQERAFISFASRAINPCTSESQIASPTFAIPNTDASGTTHKHTSGTNPEDIEDG